MSLSPDDTLRKGRLPLVTIFLGVCYPFQSTLHVFFVLFQEIEANKEMLTHKFEKKYRTGKSYEMFRRISDQQVTVGEWGLLWRSKHED